MSEKQTKHPQPQREGSVEPHSTLPESHAAAVAPVPEAVPAAPQEREPFLSNNFIYIYAFCVTLLTFLFLFMACFSSAVEMAQRKSIINTVTGFLLGVALSAIIQYFFGSSLSSKIKDDTIGALKNKR